MLGLRRAAPARRPGAAPARVPPTRDDRVDTYLRPWEFWVRMHGDRYPTLTDLAQAFLVVADVALVTDAVDTTLLDSETWGEERHYSYRFGKLVARLHGHEPFVLGDRDPHEAVAAFYTGVCRHAGALPHVNRSIRKAMASLTLDICLTLNSTAGRCPRRSGSSSGSSGTASPTWSTSSGPGWRSWPGCFALPHLFADELVARFRLRNRLGESCHWTFHAGQLDLL